MSKKFEVEYKGVTIGCDTAEQAVRLARRFGDDANSSQSRPWKLHEFEDFVDRLQLRQRRLLAALLEDGSLLDYELCRRLGLANNRALAGVLSGVSKVALALDIDPLRVYKHITRYEHGLPKRRYTVTQAFEEAAQDNAWPSAHDVEESNDDERG